MKKFFLGLFILFDIAVIAGSAFVLYTFLAHHHPIQGISATPAAAPALATPPAGTGIALSTGAVTASTPAVHAASEGASQTKIFSYRNSHAKKVAIKADFTGWRSEPMQRDATGTWTYKISLMPGEYGYFYSVDNKPPLKDPINRRTKLIGTHVVSAIVVEAPPLKSPK